MCKISPKMTTWVNLLDTFLFFLIKINVSKINKLFSLIQKMFSGVNLAEKMVSSHAYGVLHHLQCPSEALLKKRIRFVKEKQVQRVTLCQLTLRKKKKRIPALKHPRLIRNIINLKE